MTQQSNTYQLGDVTITKVPEIILDFATPNFLYKDWTDATLQEHEDWLLPGNMTVDKTRLLQSIHTWVVKTKNHTILIDTCTGNDKEREMMPALHHLKTPYLERLKAIGISVEDVDYVLLTHLHGDHVGWNTRLTDAGWVPTFPEAKYVFSRLEAEYYATPHEAAFPHDAIFNDSVRPVMDAGQAVLIDIDGSEFLDGISFFPTPGHSFDHASIVLSSKGQTALFCGDVMHHPLQVYKPDWNSVFCEKQDEAVTSRQWALDFAVEKHATVFTTHFAESSAGIVSSDKGNFSWQYLPS